MYFIKVLLMNFKNKTLKIIFWVKYKINISLGIFYSEFQHPATPLNGYNKLVAKTRYKVERVFGSIKSWFRSSGARYIGIDKMHTQHLMEAIAYNLYRSPNIILRGC
jgi:IS5 family transposase